MQENFIHDKIFERKDTLTKGVYENCSFIDSNFSEHDFSQFKFIDCIFIRCNLSLIKLNNTALRDLEFNDCKMLGIRFELCTPFGLAFSFYDCKLNHSTFYSLTIKSTVFKNCDLQEVDFAEANLTRSIFDNCNLANASFEKTTLVEVDFRTAFNYAFDPEINLMKKAKFSITGISGLLIKHDIDITQS